MAPFFVTVDQLCAVAVVILDEDKRAAGLPVDDVSDFDNRLNRLIARAI